MLQRLFRPRPAREMGKALYQSAVAQARSAGLYADLGVPDTVEGRFEAYSLHVILLIDRLYQQGEQAAETSQALFDAFAKSLDDALREMGVGDLSVGKKIRKLGEAFYSRVKAYHAALEKMPDAGDLEEIVARTVYAEGDAANAPAMATYAAAQRAHLAAQPLADILRAKVDWRPL